MFASKCTFFLSFRKSFPNNVLSYFNVYRLALIFRASQSIFGKVNIFICYLNTYKVMAK